MDLDNGTTVLAQTGTVKFPDGVEGYKVSYVTRHPFGSEAILEEIRYVWWEFMPEARRLGYSQAWIVAQDKPAPAEGGVKVKANAHRACLAADGETLWIHLDGGLTKEQRASGKACWSSR